MARAARASAARLRGAGVATSPCRTRTRSSPRTARRREQYRYAVAGLRGRGDAHRRVDRARSAPAASSIRCSRRPPAERRPSAGSGSCRSVPDAPQTRYLYHLLASHEFQEGLKNYRDLRIMQRNLEGWRESLAAFDEMVEAREQAAPLIGAAARDDARGDRPRRARPAAGGARAARGQRSRRAATSRRSRPTDGGVAQWQPLEGPRGAHRRAAARRAARRARRARATAARHAAVAARCRSTRCVCATCRRICARPDQCSPRRASRVAAGGARRRRRRRATRRGSRRACASSRERVERIGPRIDAASARAGARARRHRRPGARGAEARGSRATRRRRSSRSPPSTTARRPEARGEQRRSPSRRSLCLAALPAPADAARKSRAPATLGGPRRTQRARASRASRSTADAAQAAAQLRGLPEDPGGRSRAARPGAAPARRPAARRGRGACARRTARSRQAAAAATREAIAAYQQLLEEQPDACGHGRRALPAGARLRESSARRTRRSSVLDRLVAALPATAATSTRRSSGAARRSSARSTTPTPSRPTRRCWRAGRRPQFYEQALYKHGWSLFKQSRDEESSAAFLALLDTRAGRRRTPAAGRRDLSRARAGAEPTTRCARSRSRSPRPTARRRCRPRSTGTARRRTRRACTARSATCTSRRSATRTAPRPIAPSRGASRSIREAPLLIVRATDAYAKGGFTSLVLDGKRQLVEQYGPHSEFWRRTPPAIDPPVSARGAGRTCSISRSITTRSHRRARARTATWRCAGIATTSTDSTARRRRRRRACCWPTCCSRARATRRRPSSTSARRYAYAWQPRTRPAPGTPRSWPTTRPRRRRAGTGARRAVGCARSSPSLRFADAFPEHAETPAVLTRATRKTLFDAGDRARAEAVAQRVLALGPRADAGAAARRVDGTRAHVLRRRPLRGGRAGLRRARRRACRGRPAARRGDRAAGGVGLPAGRGAAGRRRRAAAPCRSSCAWPPSRRTSPSGAKAEYDAATLLIDAGQWNEAAAVLEKFRRSHPGHELQPEVTRKLAVAYLEARAPARRGRRVRAGRRERGRGRRGAPRGPVAGGRALRGDRRLGVGAGAPMRTTCSASRRRSSRRSRRGRNSPTSPARRATRRRASTGSRNWSPPMRRRAAAHRSQPSARGAARRSNSRGRSTRRRASMRLVVPLDRSLRARRRRPWRRRCRPTPAPPDTASPRSRPRRPTRWPTSTATSARALLESERPPRLVGRGTRAVRPAARGAGLSVRGEGDRHPRAQCAPRAPRASTTSGCAAATPRSPR